METKRECVCFAYFVDDVFIGWYGDSFGTISKFPKIYGNSGAQISTVKANFNYKMTKINETSFSKELANIPDDGEPHVEALRLLIFTDEKALKGRKVELKMVSCPIYDGPNLEFDEVAYNKLIDERTEELKALGVYDLPAGSMKRMIAIETYDKEHPKPVRNSWIYAKEVEVVPWAAIEPTEFLKVIKFNIEPKPTKDVEVEDEEETGEVEMLPPTEV